MKILILGADGMIGHKMAQTLSNYNLDIHLNSRVHKRFLEKVFPKSPIYQFDFLKQDILDLLDKVFPDIILNAAGITIRRGSEILENAIKLNSALPKKIDSWCKINQKRQIHFSTDCVFSGSKGNYLELDRPDAKDNYGFTKGNGEVNSEHTLTLRSSVIGREIFNKTELLEWVIENKNNKIKGFDKAIYSGVTTLWMSELVLKILYDFPSLSGIYNISSKPISKFELITKINELFKLNIDIEKDSSFSSNKSLNSNKFFSQTKFDKPNWDSMLLDLFNDSLKNKSLYNIDD